jgi:hypothetical protein
VVSTARPPVCADGRHTAPRAARCESSMLKRHVDMADRSVGILKSRWARLSDGRWGMRDMKGLDLIPQAAPDPAFFKFESQIELLTNSPGGNVHDFFSSFGPTDFLMKQSILPVVAWVDGENFIRCIGTASVISCSGYLMTATHVLLDPVDRKYGNVVRKGNTLLFPNGLNMGVFIPFNPAYGAHGFRFFAFQQSWCWGQWKESPLLHEDDRFQYLTDVAICKIAEMPDGVAHQPLHLSLNSFSVGEKAYALGYALMDDIAIGNRNGQLSIGNFVQDIYVSVGEVMNIFPDNHVRQDVPTPGPCFDFKAKIPGKMSGGPILGAEGSVVRGVVSRSFSGETHSFGAMLGPAMHLPLGDNMTLKILMESGSEGIAQVQGQGL